jgi:drug/metabolite transporter (DMT)-like permease
MAPPRALPLFAVVTFLLGIPYLLIAVALTGFDAAIVAWARVALAAIVLIVVIGFGPLAASLRRRPAGDLWLLRGAVHHPDASHRRG